MITKFPYRKIDTHSVDCTNPLFEQTTPNYNVAMSSIFPMHYNRYDRHR